MVTLGNQVHPCYPYSMTLAEDLSGKKFGKWSVISFNHRKELGKYNYQMWNCVCDCGKTGVIEGCSLKKGNSFSCGCAKSELTPKGDKHKNWKGDDIGYFAIHHWMRRTFGSANLCENKECAKKSTAFQWSLLKGKKYERKRENFWMLCRSCHSLYDNVSRNLPI